MKTKAEIETAIDDLQIVIVGARRANDAETIIKLRPVIDVLRWVLGKPNGYDLVFNGCRAIDRTHRQ